MKSSNPLAIGIYSIVVAIEHPVKPNEEHIFLDIVEGAQIFSSYFPKNPEEWFPNMVLTRSSFRHTKV